MISKRKFKRRGSILLTTILATIIWVFIAQCLFITSTTGFAMLRSSREAMQAQQYAEIAIDKLKNIAYDQLDTYGAHSRTQITGISSTEWQDEVTIGSEADIAGSDGAKQRIATVNVYKKGDTIPRCTLDVPLSSLSSQGNSDGYVIKCGVIPAEILNEGMYSREINFTAPFALNCYGVVLTQSYVSKEFDNAESLTNIAVKSFDKQSFTVVAGRSEFLKPIYYIAFGK